MAAVYDPLKVVKGVETGFQQFDHFKMKWEEMEYNNTLIPLTRVEYAGGPPNQIAFKVKHNQNILPVLQMGMYYDRYLTNGMFENQAGEATNYGINFHRKSLNDQYHMYVGYIINHLDIRENGGLSGIMDETDFTFLLNPNLTNSRSELKDHSFYLEQYYDFGKENYTVMLNDSDYYCRQIPNFRLYHQFEAEQSSYAYYDNWDQNDGDIYDTNYVTSNYTLDSFWTKSIQNKFGISHWKDKSEVYYDSSLNEWQERKRELYFIQMGLGQSYHHYGTYFINDIYEWMLNQNVNASLRWSLNKSHSIKTDAKLVYSGAYQGNYNLNFSYLIDQSKNAFSLNASTLKNAPTLMSQYYISNHYQWDNRAQNINIDQNQVQFEWRNKKHHLSLQLNAKQLNNWLYFDTLAIPEFSNDIQLYSVRVSKEFNYKAFHLKQVFEVNNLRQDTYALRLPLWQSYTSVYLQGIVFRRKLWGQIGIEQRWSDAYYGYAYKPAIGQFYVQDEVMVQSVPKYDAFFNFKVKDARFFVILENIWRWPSETGPISFPSNAYLYSVAHHPMNDNQFLIRFGMKWKFYY